MFIHTVCFLGVPAHAFERTGADELFDGSVEPLHLIDHIFPDHESSTGRGATDLRPQFLVSDRPYFWQESDIDLPENIYLHLIASSSKKQPVCNNELIDKQVNKLIN